MINILSVRKISFFWLVAACVLLIVAYWGGLTELVSRWNSQEEYGHGYFIPLISAWLLWKRKDAIAASIGRGSMSGIGLVLLGVFMLMFGELTAIFVLVQTGFIVSIAGLVVAWGGASLLKVCSVPLIFLVFAIPMPYLVDAKFSWYLQLISSQIGVGFLRLFGMSVFLEGNVIDLGLYKLQVVEACSGLRYLYPLLSIGFLMAYMYRGSLTQRVVLFFSTIPITVVMNSLRIAIVGFLVNQWGSGQAEGFLHYFEGWIIFMICLSLLIGEIWVFECFGRKRHVLDVIDVPIVHPVAPLRMREGLSSSFFYGLAVLAVAAVMVYFVGGREEIKPQRIPLTVFPTQFDGWVAKESSLGSDVERFLGLDDYVLGDYSNADSGSLNFYVAYYSSQRKGISPHSPQVCMPGGGWGITSLTRVPVRVAGMAPFEANRVIIEKDGARQVVYYWFDERGRRIADEYLMKWYLLKDSIFMNRTDGALVRIVAPVGEGTVEAAEDRIRRFMQVAIPKLPSYVPQ